MRVTVDDMQRASSRCIAYGLLARLFQGPADAALLRALGAVDWSSSSLAQLAPKASSLLVECLCDADAVDTAGCVYGDYQRLFCQTAGFDTSGLPLALLESDRFASDADDADDLRDDISAILDEESIAIGPDASVPCDHASVIMEAMQVFSRRLADAYEHGDDDAAAHHFTRQASFFMTHVVNWMPQLARQIEEAAATRFYRAVAALLLEVAALDEGRFYDRQAHLALDISA